MNPIYYVVTYWRNKAFDYGWLKSKSYGFPVIGVGNLSVGGTGKSPMIEYLIRLLSKDFQTATLSRGYKRKTTGFKLADASDSAVSIGDEPFQIYRKFGERIKVAVDEKRVRGITELKDQFKKIKAVILDDAYQHRYVKPGVSVLLIDYNRPLIDDHLLPWGELREPVYAAKRRANIVIVTKTPHNIKPIEKRLWIKDLRLFPYQFLFFTSFVYGKLTPVFTKRGHKLSLQELKENKISVLLVTGIANPDPLIDEIKKVSRKAEILSFPDHQDYGQIHTAAITRKFSAMKGENKVIVTTEKDAVKLEKLHFENKEVAKNLYYLPVKIQFLDGGEEEFDKRIVDFVTKNKRVSRLHK